MINRLFCIATFLLIKTFPPLVRVGVPYSYIILILMCWSLGYIFYWFRSNPQEIPDFSRIPTFDGFANPMQARKIFWAAELIFIHVWVYYLWHNNWWQMSNAYWLSMYCYWWFGGYVFYRWRKNG